MAENSESESNIELEEVSEPAVEEPEPVDKPADEPVNKTKKRPGRPCGSKDQAPRKRRVRVQQVAIEHAQPSEQPEMPRVLPESRPIPFKPRDPRSASMIELLQNHARARQQRKAELWSSW